MSFHIPDAPGSVKHWSGVDPSANPPHEEPDEIFSETCCKCGQSANPDESVYNETTDEWTCCNCIQSESDLWKRVKQISNQMAATYRRHEPIDDV